MSQAKVDRYKQEKYNRKNNKKKGSAKKILSYAIVTLVGVAFVVYIGYSIAVATGMYTPPVATTHVELSHRYCQYHPLCLSDHDGDTDDGILP